jgi:hypothetical protein
MVSCHLKKYTIPLKYYTFKAIIATGNASSLGNNAGIFFYFNYFQLVAHNLLNVTHSAEMISFEIVFYFRKKKGVTWT